MTIIVDNNYEKEESKKLKRLVNKISRKKDYEFDIVYLGINFTQGVFISNKVITFN